MNNGQQRGDCLEVAWLMRLGDGALWLDDFKMKGGRREADIKVFIVTSDFSPGWQKIKESVKKGYSWMTE